MRTRANIHLDEDAYSFAAAYASAKGIALGAAISELLRRAEGTLPQATTSLKKNARGLLVRAKTARSITPGLVKEASEDDLA